MTVTEDTLYSCGGHCNRPDYTGLLGDSLKNMAGRVGFAHMTVKISSFQTR